MQGYYKGTTKGLYKGLGFPEIRGTLFYIWARFPSSPCIIRVDFFLLFGFDTGTLKLKGQTGTTQEPRGSTFGVTNFQNEA